MSKLIAFAVVFLSVTGGVWWATTDATATQTAVVALTGLVVIWYIYETSLLRAETQKQTEMSQRPFVITKFHDDKFELCNLGPGVALNVWLKPVEVDTAYAIQIRFPQSVPVLSPGETTEIEAESFKGDTSAGQFFLAHLDPAYANRELSMEVRFQNLDFRDYATEERIQPGKRVITGFSVKRA